MATPARFGWRRAISPSIQGRQRAHSLARLDSRRITLPIQPSISDHRLVKSRSLILQRTPIKAWVLLLVATILTSQNGESGFYSLMWHGSDGMSGIGVRAEPCATVKNASLATDLAAWEFKEVTVSNDTSFNISTMFACENGAFNVSWSGIIHVSTTITIGRGTTVRIFGDYVKSLNESNASITSNSSVVARTSRDGSINTRTTDSSSNSSRSIISVDLELELERLSSGLNIPQGLTSAAVRANGSVSFGPIFFVDGGELHLEGVAVRGGNSTNSTSNAILLGGGVHANSSNVSIFDCIFEDNFAEYNGGGIHADMSSLVVKNSVFRGNKAGFESSAGDDDVEGDGGAIASENTKMFFDGCLFDANYASNKGGGVHMGRGQVSVVNSLFFNNLAGSDNQEDEDPVGMGAAFSFTVCTLSFDGLSPCGVNDSTFIYNAAANKGGTIAVGSGIGPSYIEFHRCFIDNSTTGWPFDDDPQGTGGAFSMGDYITLVLEDCVVSNNYCSKKGAAVILSEGSKLIVRNSTFEGNFAELGEGGTIYLEDFATARLEGDSNNFTGNACGTYGGVLAATTNTNVTVEGGWFEGNKAGENGGAFWSKSTLTIVGGNFTGNAADENGGAVFASTDSSVTISNGRFKENEALNGGVVYVSDDSVLAVRGGVYSENKAKNGGGAFYASNYGNVEIAEGIFTRNAADFGGFLYTTGNGNTSCTGASVVGHRGVDGGALYAVDGAFLDWSCNLIENTALVGPAIYARAAANVTIHGATLSNNNIARGSVVFVVFSSLQTYQVVFSDNTNSVDLSAVQSGENSMYVAEETAFVGFKGEAVVFSEGTLYLDDCDFSGSSASTLVYSDPSSHIVIRNTVLGDNNFDSVIQEASEASAVPVSASLINVAINCSESGSPCSPGSICLEGQLGVYCQCYHKVFTFEEVCLDGHPEGLSLSKKTSPPNTFYPSLLEGDLVLSVDGDDSRSSSSLTSLQTVTPGRLTSGGVVWNVSALFHELISWTIFPSVGLLYPGQNITLRVVSSPDPNFDGPTKTTFAAVGIGAPEAIFNRSSSGSSHAEEAQDVDTSTFAESSSNEVHIKQDMNVTFFHCRSESFWNLTIPSDIYGGSCELCSSIDKGVVEGLDCSDPGASTRNLPIRSGYWRASLSSTWIRECLNEAACIGTSTAESVDEYCATGYKGPYCAVCSPGYGHGSGSSCHECTAEFKGVVYFLFALAVLITFIVIGFLGIYLVGGRVAVSQTVSTTKESVRNLRRRRLVLLLRSELWGRQDMGVNTFSCSNSSRAGISVPLEPRKRAAAIERIMKLRLESVKVSANRKGATKGNQSSRGRNDRANEKLGFAPGSTSGPSPALASGLASTPAPALTLGKKEGCALIDGRGVDSFHVSYPPPCEEVGSGRSKAVKAPVPTCDNGGGGYIEDALHKRKRGREEGSRGAKRRDEKHEEKKQTTAAIVGGVLGALPLSKLKIVIVVWQISCSFAEITDVHFPEVYDRFLSFIGIFSFDLGWILSAACMNVDLNFYVKLIIATIGPVFLLGLLCVTFYLGARPKMSVSSNRFDAEVSSSNATTPFTASSPDRMLGSGWGRARGLQRQEGAPRSSTIETNDTLLASHRRSAVTRRGSRGHSHYHRNKGTSISNRPPAKSGTFEMTPTENVRWNGKRDILSDLTAASDAASFAASFAENETKPRKGKEKREELASLQPELRWKNQRSIRRILKSGPGDDGDFERKHLWRLFSRHTTMTLIILYLIYSQVSTVVFQTFMCDDLDDIGKSYLIADFRIECYTSTHSAYKIYAAIMAFVYPLGIPVTFWYVLAMQRLRINPAIDKSFKDTLGANCVMAEKEKKRKDDPIVAPTSFLWAAYYPNRYYFEVCECLRRLLLTGVLVFLEPNTSGQVAYSCLFSFISLLAFELLRPHMDFLDLMLYRTGCLVIFFTNFLGLMIKAEVANPDSQGTAVYSVVLIIVNMLFFLSIWGNTFATIRAIFSRRHIQGVMIGVDILKEDKIDTLMTGIKEESGKGRGEPGGEIKMEDVDDSSKLEIYPSVVGEHNAIKSNRSDDRILENEPTSNAITSAEEGSIRTSRSLKRQHPFRCNGGASAAWSTSLQALTVAVPTASNIIECGPRSRGFPYTSTGSDGMHLSRNPAQSLSTVESPCHIANLEV